MQFSPDEIAKVAGALLGAPNKSLSKASQLRFGSNGSVAVELWGRSAGTWYDHERGVGGGLLDLVREHHGLTNGEAIAWLRTLGVSVPDRPGRGAGRADFRIVAEYDYHDRDGALVFQVVRLEPKSFRQRRPDGRGGWDWSVKGLRLPPYRLGELAKAVAAGRTVFIPEGEKDVDALRRLDLVATCNPGGAGKWPDHFAEHFVGAQVVILPDNDDAGRRHAEMIAANLLPVAASVRVVTLPGLPPKGDVSDWIAAGNGRESLIALCRTAAALPVPGERVAGTAKEADPGGGADDEALPPEYSDEALALRFAERYGSDARYVAAWSKWFLWDGVRWRADDTLKALDMARTICREASAECHDARAATSIASAKTVAAVERLARADRRIAATVDQWDRDAWLLNTPEGVVDLKTGQTRPARREDYMTKVTAVAPNGDCPTWRAFLHQVTAGDVDLQLYLQRLAGYTLTGSVKEHALVFCYGPGGNGKGTFLNALTAILKDYAAVASIEAFTASTAERHPTDLAALRGARLVTAQETEEGRRWAESKIKALTGGDPITARFMRCDFFTYEPQFKLVIAGNHKPGLRNVDEAMRRRFHLVPFTVTIPKDQRDPDLPVKLRDEWPGILAWAVDGCSDWDEQNGLHPPPAVVAATDEYLEAEDALGQWLAECCEPKAGVWSGSSALYASWKAWADGAGEFAGSQKRFSQNLEKRGYAPKRHGVSGKAGFDGIRIKAAPEPDSE